MTLLKRVSIGIFAALLVCAVVAIQARGFQYYPGNDRDARSRYLDECNSTDKAEFYWSRLKYPSQYGGFGGGRRFGGGGFGFGGGGCGEGFGPWQRDYPKADIQFLMAMRRLTNVNTRSTSQVVDLDAPDSDPHSLDNYPWVYAVQAQTWSFNADEAKKMHDYLMKGGFLMVDDFHGAEDWELFMQGLHQFLPNAQVEDLKDTDEIFHVLFDLSQRVQIPGEQYVWSGRTYEAGAGGDIGYVPGWRAVRDDKGRIIVAICFNMHLGDAWEWADDPRYPEKFASLAFRVGLNYIVYGMTH
jgi:hypothetical protein